MSKTKDINIDTILTEDYQAQESIIKFVSDAHCVQNWVTAYFRGGIKKSDPQYLYLKNAADNAITLAEEGIAALRASFDQFNNREDSNGQ